MKFFEVIDMLSTLVIEMTSQINYVQTHQEVFIKYVEFFEYHVNLKKVKNNNSKD